MSRVGLAHGRTPPTIRRVESFATDAPARAFQPPVLARCAYAADLEQLTPQSWPLGAGRQSRRPGSVSDIFPRPSTRKIAARRLSEALQHRCPTASSGA